MSNINLSDENVAKHIDSFHSLNAKPSFSISDDTDTHILFFKRKDKYYGVRTGSKTDFESLEEFIVHSFLVEEIRAHIKNKLVLEQLTIEDCSNVELGNVFTKAKRIGEHLPDIVDVERSYTIANNSDLNWKFLETKSKFHSVFWSETETKFFSRCA
ncbi:MAG: hypothetical protein AB8B81_14965 [Halioglobus sp.]